MKMNNRLSATHKNSLLGKNDKTLWKEVSSCVPWYTPTHILYQDMPGPRRAAKCVQVAMDCWPLLLTQELLNEFLACINIYIDSKHGKCNDKSIERHTNEREMKAIIGLLYLLEDFRAN